MVRKCRSVGIVFPLTEGQDQTGFSDASSRGFGLAFRHAATRRSLHQHQYARRADKRGKSTGQSREGDNVRQQTILSIWAGGIVLAIVLYAIGPDRFVSACLDSLLLAEAAFRNLMLSLGMHAYNLVRAAAIAMYVVFAVLGGMAAFRGLRAWSALIIVTGVFLVLVWRPEEIDPTPVGRWLAGLVLCLAAAFAMTRRLTAPPATGADKPAWPRYPGKPG
jgi:hypothetical protein